MLGTVATDQQCIAQNRCRGSRGSVRHRLLMPEWQNLRLLRFYSRPTQHIKPGLDMVA